MKRIVILVGLFAVLGGGVFAYSNLGGGPEVRRGRHLAKAREYLARSKVNEAMIEFKNALQADPRSPEAHYEFGMVLLKRQDFRAAYREFVRTTDLKPDFLQARFQLATIDAASNEIRRAKLQLETMRQLDRNAKETRYLGAQIAMLEKQPDIAIQELEAALDIEREKAAVYVDLGHVHMSKKDYLAAETAFRKALEVDPKFHRARMASAQLYVATGHPVKAEAELLLATEAHPENDDLVHALGNFYMTSRRIDDLERLYRDFVNKKPESLTAKKRLAEIYLGKNDLIKTRLYVDEILKAHPSDVDGLYVRGRVNLAENRLQKAVDDLTMVARSAPKFAQGFYFLGIGQQRLNQIHSAKKNFARSVELAPNYLDPRLNLAQLHLVLGDHGLALEEVETILNVQPDNEAALQIKGAIEVKRGDTSQALKSFKQVLKINPQNISALVNMGAVYTLKKKYAEALKEYEEALKLDSQRLDALGALAQVYLLQNNSAKAFERVEQHLGKTQNEAGVYQLLGQLSINSKKYTEGIEYLEKAISLNPDLSPAYLLIGNAYAAQRKFDAAIEQYEKVSQMNPRAVQPLMLVGILYDMNKEPKKANEYYQRVLDMNKNVASAANNLAYNYAQHGGNLDVALGLAQRARELKPNDPSIADTLGWIQYKRGNYGMAVELLKESNEKFKNSNPTVLYHLGVAYKENGHSAKAKEALARALTVSQDFQEAPEARNELGALNREASLSSLR